MKLIESIKFGFGFCIGYEFGKIVIETAKEVYPAVKKRIKQGY